MAERLGIDIEINGKTAERDLDRLNAKLDELGRHAKTTEGRVTHMEGVAGSAFKRLAGLAAGISFVAIGKQIVDQTIKFQGYDITLRAVLGSQEAAAEGMKFIQSESERLGLNINSTASSFVRLAAAAKGTALQGKGAQDIFSAIAESARVLHLSADQTSSSLLAIEQIISKGTVQSQELRLQLGNNLPGAFQIAARAAGVTTAKLGDMLQSGELLATDFLPKFAAELRKTFGGGVAEAVNASQASFERLGNSIKNLENSIGKSGLIDYLAEAADLATGVIKNVGFLVDAFSDLQTKDDAVGKQEGAINYVGAVGAGIATLADIAHTAVFTITTELNTLQKYLDSTADVLNGYITLNFAKSRKAAADYQSYLGTVQQSILNFSTTHFRDEFAAIPFKNYVEAQKGVNSALNGGADAAKRAAAAAIAKAKADEAAAAAAKAAKQAEKDRLADLERAAQALLNYRNQLDDSLDAQSLQNKMQAEEIRLRERTNDEAARLSEVRKAQLRIEAGIYDQATQAERNYVLQLAAERDHLNAIAEADNKAAEARRNRQSSIQTIQDRGGTPLDKANRQRFDDLSAVYQSANNGELGTGAEAERKKNELLLQVHHEYADAVAEIDKKYHDDLVNRLQDETKLRRDAIERITTFETDTKQRQLETTINLGAQLLEYLGTHNKKAFKAAKVLAIADATIQGIGAVQKTYNSLPFPANIAAAALVAAKTIANVQQIKATQYSGGGGSPSTGGSGSVGGGNALTTTPLGDILNQRQQNRQKVEIKVEGKNFDRDTITELINGINDAVSDGVEIRVT